MESKTRKQLVVNEERSLKNKDISIKKVIKIVLNYFGKDFFDRYSLNDQLELIDFWDADLYAMGLKRNQKVVYISTWDYRFNSIENMKYHVEFELIDNKTLETKSIIKQVNINSIEQLVKEIEVIMT